MKGTDEKNDFPREYDFLKRKEIERGTALITDEERNELIIGKCKKAALFITEYNSGNRGHKMDWIRYELDYLCYVRGIENKFVENQISRLTFELHQLQGVTAYLSDPRGLKIAVKTIERIIESIIEELEVENERI